MKVVCRSYRNDKSCDEPDHMEREKVVLEMMVRHGLDLTLLSRKQFNQYNKNKYVFGLLVKFNISHFRVFGQVHNRNVKRPLSIRKA